MTRYAEGHKDKTRAHLLQTARAVFRERGFETTSIDNLMKEAGLTRGGFYAHFDSKEALVREVLRIEPGLVVRLRALSSTDEGRTEAAAAFDEYLAEDARPTRVQCPLVAHPMDARRGGGERAAIYAEQVEGLVATLKGLMGDRPDAEHESTVLGVLAIGAAIVSSVVPDPRLAAKIETEAREEIRRRIAGPAPQ